MRMDQSTPDMIYRAQQGACMQCRPLNTNESLIFYQVTKNHQQEMTGDCADPAALCLFLIAFLGSIVPCSFLLEQTCPSSYSQARVRVCSLLLCSAVTGHAEDLVQQGIRTIAAAFQ
jgi:hypothetical protein